MKNPWILPAAALLVGGAGGFLAGKTGASAPTPDASASPVARSSRASGGGLSGGESRSKAKSIADIRKSPGQTDRVQALLDYYRNMDPSQLEAEAKKLESMPLNERVMASILLFGRWAEVDPTAAMAYSDKMGMGGMLAKPTILQSWASSDPANAAKYFAEHPGEFQMMGFGGMGGRGGNGGGGATIIAAEWAKSDPDAAMQWANSLQGRDKTQAMASVVRELAGSDPQKAVSLAAGLDGDAKTEALSSIASQWGAKDFTAAEAWIKSLPADQQDAAMGSAISSLASTDPKQASEKIAAMADGQAKKDAITSVVNAWSKTDPQVAAQWLLSQGTDNTSNRSMRDLMSNWSRQDDAGAVAFLTAQPAGPAKDEATQSYIWSNRSDNPQAVVALAETITDENSRDRAMGAAVGRWMQTDPAAAKAYIDSSTTLSDATKARLEGGGGGGRGNRGGAAGAGGGGRGGRRGGGAAGN